MTSRLLLQRTWKSRICHNNHQPLWSSFHLGSLQASSDSCSNFTRRRPPSVASVHNNFAPRGMRPFSSSSSSPDDWRKQQLQTLQRKFQDTDKQQQNSNNNIQSDEDLQPMWKELEGRVTRRKPRTVQQMGGRTGRVNVRPTDEEVWAQEGLYNNNNDQHTQGDNNKEATKSSDRDSNEKESK